MIVAPNSPSPRAKESASPPASPRRARLSTSASVTTGCESCATSLPGETREKIATIGSSRKPKATAAAAKTAVPASRRPIIRRSSVRDRQEAGGAQHLLGRFAPQALDPRLRRREVLARLHRRRRVENPWLRARRQP